MAMNRVQLQTGLSMAEFLERYGTEDKCEAALVAARWPRGFAFPDCGTGGHTVFLTRRAPLLAVRRLPAPVQRHQRYRLRGRQVAAEARVRGHAPAHPGQEQPLDATNLALESSSTRISTARLTSVGEAAFHMEQGTSCDEGGLYQASMVRRALRSQPRRQRCGCRSGTGGTAFGAFPACRGRALTGESAPPSQRAMPSDFHRNA